MWIQATNQAPFTLDLLLQPILGILHSESLNNSYCIVIGPTISFPLVTRLNCDEKSGSAGIDDLVRSNNNEE
jgi:hypothetical protein